MPIKLEPEDEEPEYQLEDECSITKPPSSQSSRNKHHHHHHSSRNEERSSKEEKKHKSSGSKKSSDSKHHKSHHSRSSHDESSLSKRKYEETSKENEESKKKPKLENGDSKKEPSSSTSKTNSSRSSNNHHSKSTSSKSLESSNSSSAKIREEKSPKKKINIEPVEEDEMDGSQGMGFAEALALFDMPTTSKKKDTQLADKIVKTKSSSSRNSKKIEKKPSTSSSEDTKKSLKSLTKLTETPKILTQKPKLEPLPDIVNDLPSDVSIPDYRPMPLTSAVKDYINNVQGSSYNNRPQQIQKTDVELLTESFSSKANRTKVYSGNRTLKNLPSLFDLCIRLLQENIDSIENTGGVPFDILRPVLEKAKPDQLRVIEYYNPYLLDESDVLWEPHCKRKFRTRQRLEMETWRELYERCTTEDEEKLNRLTQNIKQHQVTTSNGVQKTMLAFVDSMVKPPRNIMRKQEIYGTNKKLVVSPAARTVGLKNMAPNLASAGDARLRIAAGIRDDAQNGELISMSNWADSFTFFFHSCWSRNAKNWFKESSNDGENPIEIQAINCML